ncbi:MAG: hypothetical protein HY303_21645 [Candidatus Wallbacteria bacterium]|nr:hypothetical protein [Candidatus Wallbacteria bacterium]
MAPTTHRLFARAVVLLLATLVGAAALAAAPPKVVRAVVLEFPDLQKISAEQARASAVRAEQLCERLFGLSVRIEVAAAEDAEAAFDRWVPPGERLDRSGGPTPAEAGKMRQDLEAFLLKTPVEGIDRLLPPGSASKWASLVVDRYLARGRALAKRLGLTEMKSSRRAVAFLGTWDRLMRAKHGWDLLLTNGPVLYSSQDGSALHALLRGGIIGGVTIWNIGARTHGGAAMVSSYCLDSGDPDIASLRGRPALTGADRADTLAALIAHELGHLFLKLPDNYGHPGCLMHPPLGLEYLEWARGARPQGCEDCRRVVAPAQSRSSSTPSSSSSTASPR